MKNVLVVSAHDTVIDSVATTYILEDLQQRMPNAVFDNLDELYPNFIFDVKAEQAKLEAADIIVLQFPFYWYSMPGVMHRWMEFVFEHGWSHGTTGQALKGKTLIASFTTGAPEFLYAKDNLLKHTLEEFMAPCESIAILTGMQWGGFVVTDGVSYADRKPENEAETRNKLEAHVTKLIKKIENA